MRVIATDTVGTAQEPMLHMHFPVRHSHFLLLDSNTRRTVHPGEKQGESSAEILRTVRGGAFLVTGLAYGVVDLTAGVSAHRPVPRLEDYDDVVEASVDLDTPDIALCPSSGAAVPGEGDCLGWR